MGISEIESPPAGRYAMVDISKLRVGAKLRMPIYDPEAEQDVLLLAAGTRLAADQLTKLKQRGISQVRVHGSELCRLTSSGGEKQAKAGRTSSRTRNAVLTPFSGRIERHGTTAYDGKSVEKSAQYYQESVAQTEELFHSLSQGDGVDGKAVIAAANASMEQMTTDLDLFVSLGISAEQDGLLYTHSVKTSRMAIAVGAVMGLSQQQLLELGIGCMVHDVGMLRIDRRLYDSQRILTPIEFLEITKHPIYTFEMIQEIKELPLGARMVAYQMHERWNGSGYPRRRQGKQIHQLSRIAAVADEFVAKISPRPYRPALLPYSAMAEIIRSARDGLFDPDAVRGLLHTVSLFPVGSYVELMDGRVGKVIRANGEKYAQPVVEVWSPGRTDAGPVVVDLSAESDGPEVTVRQPLSHLNVAPPPPSPSAKAIVGDLRQLRFFDVGAYVEMSDGRIGRVARANGELFSQPVVEVWARDEREAAPEVVDLACPAAAGELHIKCCLSASSL